MALEYYCPICGEYFKPNTNKPFGKPDCLECWCPMKVVEQTKKNITAEGSDEY